MPQKSIDLENYYNRHDPAKNYDQVLIRDGYAGQGAEINEIQSAFIYRLKGIADVLMRDGDVIRDAGLTINAETGETRCENGAVYIAGAVRGIPAASFTLPITGTVTVGVYLRETVVTELEDPALYNPAVGSSAEGEPGAARLQIVASWGWQATDRNDGATGTGTGSFYPVYTVDDAQLRVKEIPPSLDAVAKAIEIYDRDSAGGDYVIEGLRVISMPDTADGRQQYTLTEGKARIGGAGIELPTSRRILYNPVPDLLQVQTEPHLLDGTTQTPTGPWPLILDMQPVKNVHRVAITVEKSVTVTHAYAGSRDLLPDSAVVDLVEVQQGGTTYVKGADFRLLSNQVDWSLSGAEPSAMSSYTVKYHYVRTFAVIGNADSITDGAGVTTVHSAGLTIVGAVPGTQALVSYDAMIPRVDRLCLRSDGIHEWVPGTASMWRPKPPPVPRGMLPVAAVTQTWTTLRAVSADAVRMVPMAEINAINEKIVELAGMVAAQQLVQDMNLRESGHKKGFFVDPFMGDTQRDQGITQTAAIVGGELTLPVLGEADHAPGDISKPESLPFTLVPVLAQLARSGSMKVNPYMAFDPIPAQVTLTPPVDRWVQTESLWTSEITRRLVRGSGNASSTSTSTGNELVSEQRTALEFLRQIDVAFTAKGFGPKERLLELTFDGVVVEPKGA